MILISAGIMSPANKSTISPGTICLMGVSLGLLQQSTVAVARISLNLSASLPARYT